MMTPVLGGSFSDLWFHSVAGHFWDIFHASKVGHSTQIFGASLGTVTGDGAMQSPKTCTSESHSEGLVWKVRSNQLMSDSTSVSVLLNNGISHLFPFVAHFGWLKWCNHSFLWCFRQIKAKTPFPLGCCGSSVLWRCDMMCNFCSGK